jgi:uncharacterized protein (TIGR02145 family)
MEREFCLINNKNNQVYSDAKPERTKSFGVISCHWLKYTLFVSLIWIVNLVQVNAQIGYVSGVQASQRDDGSGRVEISYTLVGYEPLRYHLVVEVSFDGGGSYQNIPVNHLDGDLINVSPSDEPYSIVWDGLATHPYVYSEQTIVKVNIELAMVQDIDGNSYPTTIIGEQEWIAKNLRVTRYNNGDLIPLVETNSEWPGLTQGAYGVYQNHFELNTREKVLDQYGALYNWYAVNDTRGICPVGWHVPDNDDWTQLVEYLMTEYDLDNTNFSPTSDLKGVGNALKSCRQADSPLGGDCATEEYPRWNSYLSSGFYGTDDFGFSALPAGIRAHESGNYGSSGSWAVFWSADEFSEENAFFRALVYNRPDFHVFHFPKGRGYSVRCVKAVND